MSGIVTVLADVVTLARVFEFAEAAGWELRSDVVRAHFVLSNKGWRSSPATTIDYFEDHTADVRFVRAKGSNATTITRALRRQLEHHDEESLLAALESSDEPVTWIRGLGRLGVARPEAPDDRYLSLWTRALSDERRPVRRAAIRTAYNLRWAPLLSVVRQRVSQDEELGPALSHLATFLERDLEG